MVAAALRNRHLRHATMGSLDRHDKGWNGRAMHGLRRCGHAIVLGTPTTAEVEVDARLRDHALVMLEDQPGALEWEPRPHGTRITLPEPPDEQPAIALRLAPRSAVS
jgi:hypothetical protein